jgi:SET domain
MLFFGKFIKTFLRRIHHLNPFLCFESHYFKPTYYKFQIALYLSALLKIPQSELLRVSAVLLKLVLVIIFNRKCIYAFKTNYEQIGISRIPLGEVMYLAVSLINHACDASTYLVSYGSHVVYRARRPIEKGEQLTDCYVMSAANASFRERQKFCKSQYKFICK